MLCLCVPVKLGILRGCGLGYAKLFSIDFNDLIKVGLQEEEEMMIALSKINTTKTNNNNNYYYYTIIINITTTTTTQQTHIER